VITTNSVSGTATVFNEMLKQVCWKE
jgi:hypothetical protein